jgi:hypothetical protein
MDTMTQEQIEEYIGAVGGGGDGKTVGNSDSNA